MDRFFRSVDFKPGCFLAFAAVLGALARLAGVVFPPADWLDSVQVAEIARPLFGCQDWGMNLLPGQVKADGAWAFYWVGSAVHEAAYQLLGPKGPRLAAFVAHILLGAFAWRTMGMMCGFSVLAFAPLVQSVNYGRVDVYALLFVFCAIYFANKRQAFVAGVCGAFAVMTWFTVVFSLPLAVWSLGRGSETRWRDILRFICGLLLMFAILWSPFYGCLDEMLRRFDFIQDSFAGMSGGLGAKIAAFSGEAVSLYGGVTVIAGAVLLLFAIRAVRVGVWWDVLPFLFFTVFALACLLKRSYVFRSVYFLPYIIIAVGLIAGGLCRIRAAGFAIWFLSALMFAQTAAYWPFFLWRSRNDRDYNHLKVALEREAGRNIGIYCDTYQPYYVGRSLSWRQFRTWCGERKGMAWILAKADVEYYLGHGEYPENDVAAMLRRAGFAFEKIVMPADELKWDGMHWWRLGPYNLWRKKK